MRSIFILSQRDTYDIYDYILFFKKRTARKCIWKVFLFYFVNTDNVCVVKDAIITNKVNMADDHKMTIVTVKFDMKYLKEKITLIKSERI